MTVAIDIVGVSKRFGPTVALDALSLGIAPGSFLGLVGRNGAGKTTLLRIVTGLYAPDAGTVRVTGLDPRGKDLDVKRRMGVMPDDGAVLDRLTARQFLRFVGRMHGLSDAVADERARELLDQLELAPDPRALICDYSYGMKKKVAVCAALLHAPAVVLLDEPFEGLDPVTSRALKNILNRLRERGVTLVLTSHVLDVVERLCPDVAIIDQGRLRARGSPEAIAREHGVATLEEAFIRIVGAPEARTLSWA